MLPHMPLLDADAIHPITLPDGTVYSDTVYLKNVIDHPRIEVGEFSYFIITPLAPLCALRMDLCGGSNNVLEYFLVACLPYSRTGECTKDSFFDVAFWQRVDPGL